MNRNELIEVMARAIWKDDYGAMLYEAREYSGQPNGESAWREVEWMREAATTALTAIEAAGMRVVPEDYTPANIALRDAFIVGKGLWQEFIDHLTSKDQQ